LFFQDLIAASTPPEWDFDRPFAAARKPWAVPAEKYFMMETVDYSDVSRKAIASA